MCALGLVGLWASLPGCSQDSQNVSVRSFDRPQKMATLCMKVFSGDPAVRVPIPPEPANEDRCGPLPQGVFASALDYHLYALVTQTARGELGVVDLTAGVVIDQERGIPGINFLPVGANPTDVVVSPDGETVFVSSVEPNKFAVYAIPSRRLLGDSQGLAVDQTPERPLLTSFASCALPQAPGMLAVSRVAGLGDGSAEGYRLIAVLLDSASGPARMASLDVGALVSPDGGTGSLSPCRVTQFVTLSATVPTASVPGTWQTGLERYGASVDLDDKLPSNGVVCSEASAGGVGSVADGGIADGGDATDAASGAGSEIASFVSGRSHPTALAIDGDVLYVADGVLPLIHAVRVGASGELKALPPLAVTSRRDPTRVVTARGLAMSPETRDYKRFLYAIDAGDGSLIVYDVSNPDTAYRQPLERPFAALNPLAPPDRIVFSAPVATVAFVRHDFPVDRDNNLPVSVARSGALCNPNPNADPDDPGIVYRANNGASTADAFALTPNRLRGVFAFATLSNGQSVVVDVDDWNAPCRRPDPLDDAHKLSDLAAAEPAASSPVDTDPYHAPRTFTAAAAGGASPVTLEWFHPITSPHRLRSAYLLKNDPLTGIHAPYLISYPQLLASKSPVPTVGEQVLTLPQLLPTASALTDPTAFRNPNEPDPSKRELGPVVANSVRLSFEVPEVHVDQDWSVTYEGALSGFDALALSSHSDDEFKTLTLSQASALFCGRGVEDVRVASARAKVAMAEADKVGAKVADRLDRHVGDYVQLIEDVRGVDDPYWSQPNDECWAADEAPSRRYDTCQATFGNAVDQKVSRDLPILEAYDDRLVLGRFGYPDGAAQTTSNREIVGANPTNAGSLKQVHCCFHKQVKVTVRTAGEWVAVGSRTGYLHHMVADPVTRACVPSCDATDSLLNSRSFEVDVKVPLQIGRNSPLAMRNPMLSYVTRVQRFPTLPDFTFTKRDYGWIFSVRGQFIPLSVNLASDTNSISPQTSRFVGPLNQLAVIDASTKGLMLIDLGAVVVARAPYF